MAIQWADDFSRYGFGTNGSTGTASRLAMLEGLPYAVIGSIGGGYVANDPDPSESGRAFILGANGNDWPEDFRIALPTVVSGTVGVVCRAWMSQLPEDEGVRCGLIQVQRGDGDILVYMRVELNGSIVIIGKVSDEYVILADTVNPVVSPSSWIHYEFVHNVATGEGSLYLNGIERVTWEGVDTADAAELVNFSKRTSTDANAGTQVYLKDFVTWDGTGTANNSVMGTVLVRRLKPNGDNTLGGWVPSTGTTGFNLLAKDQPDDSTFLSADNTPPSPMIFDLEDLPPDITSVRGLISVVRMRKVDGGDANVQNALSPDGTDWDNGADRPITTAFTYYLDVSELDPATASAWSPVAVDDALLRIDRTD